ncbi:unnamed protein product [Staurois parvus]|uniref:Uncharacterized protein n=1 Tax=Staurois parvus TaxID=386267 RepID=A0ABN9FKY2_9NEOB|nr:unnamed protein product [Staurois parvus]
MTSFPDRALVRSVTGHLPWTRPMTDLCTGPDCCTGPVCEIPIYVITDWPISDHMNSSKQDVTC